MALSMSSEAIIELGKKLVQELRLQESSDTLARWMAHLLAEKISLLDSSAPADKGPLEAHIVDLILRVWQQRDFLPDGKRPFEGLEDIGRILKQLDPLSPDGRYFHPAARRQAATAATGAKVWLDRAIAIDDAARGVINYCLHAADGASPNHSEEWAALAKAAGLDNDIEVKLAAFLDRIKHPQLADVLDEAQGEVQKRVAKLRQIVEEIEADISNRPAQKKREE